MNSFLGGSVVGDLFREARHCSKMSQSELARYFGVAQNRISWLEHGIGNIPPAIVLWIIKALFLDDMRRPLYASFVEKFWKEQRAKDDQSEQSGPEGPPQASPQGQPKGSLG